MVVVVPLRFSSAGVGGRRLSFYREFPPSAGLSTVVQCTWEGVPGWARALRVLPDGCVDIAWDGQRLFVSAGFVATRVPLSASGTSVGVRLRCGAAGGLLGPGFASAGAVADLHDLISAGARIRADLDAAPTATAQRGVLERFVARRLRAGFAPDPAMPVVVCGLAVPDARVDGVADQVGLSARTLRRRVHAAVGCGPKELHRVLRFHRFLRRLGDLTAGHTTLSSLAAGLGFADQSHLGHECLRLSGSSPARLMASYARHTDLAETNQTATS